MSSKQRLRKKFIFFRKKKYFPIRKNIFKPIISIISKRKIKRISLYYPSNHEFDTIKLIEILNNSIFVLTTIKFSFSLSNLFEIFILGLLK